MHPLAVPLGVAWLALSWEADARDFRVSQLPNGTVFSCSGCHVSSSGGGTRNSFGRAVEAVTGASSRAFWSPTLAAADSDGDGAANGVELGDPEGDGTRITGWKVTNPGSATSKPVAVNQAPQVTVTGPAEGLSLLAPAVAPVTVVATDSDGSVAKVEFFSNGRLLGTVTQAPFSLMVDWPVGAQSVTAKATDNQGLSATSSAVAFAIGLPQAPQMAAPVRSTDSAQLAWVGGGGPFAVEEKGSLSEPWCSASDVVAGRAATIATRGAAGFVRVTDFVRAPAIPLSSWISGAFEVPAVTGGTGTGSAIWRIEGSTLSFDVRYSGLTGPATAAHIHGLAGVDGTAGILIDLSPFSGGGFGTSGTLAGSMILTAEQKAAILSGRTYVNLHTEQRAGGEVRGQIVPVQMSAALGGANERPSAADSAGLGEGLFLLAGDRLTFNLSYAGLSGSAVAAHIHGPADAFGTAGVMIDLAPFHGGGFGESGTFAGVVALTPTQWAAVASGRAYVNVHTAKYPGGEVRGQIRPGPASVPLTATLGGAFERPTAINSAGTGSATLALSGDVLLFEVRYSGLTGPAVAAHLHGAAAGSETAGPMLNLLPYQRAANGGAGAFSGAIQLTADQRTAVLAGRTYLNIHTAANGGGEIRGQVTPVLFVAQVNGANEKPAAVNVAGMGSGHFLLAGDQLWLNVSYRGLSGAATAAHIHGAADANATAGVLLDFAPFHGGGFGASGGLSGTATLNSATLSALVDGLTYVNFHTDANKGGEIRGQVLRPATP